MKYLIKVINLPKSPHSIIIDNVVLDGEYNELFSKMSDINYIESLGIDESFLFEQFELIPEDSYEENP